MGNENFAPRVLHVLDHSLPLHSGYAFRSQNILRCQQALGWYPFAVTSIKHQLGLNGAHAGGIEESIEGIRFYRSKLNSKRTGEYFSQYQVVEKLFATLKQVIVAERPDLMHVHSPALNALPALALGKKFRIPVIYEIRAFWEDAAVDHGTYMEGSWKYRMVHWLETWVCQRANHLAVLCDGIKHDLKKRGISQEQITIVPNGIHIAEFQPGLPDQEFRDRWGLKGKTVIGFLGSFYRYEGLDLLIEAFSHLRQKYRNLVLLLVGGGEVEDELKMQVKKLSLSSDVIFPGRVPHQRVPGVYGLMTFLVYPRKSIRLTELVTPLKPLEAMAMEKPLIASDIGGHRELIQDGKTGVLFQAGNLESLVKAFEALLDDPSLAKRIVSEGKAWVAHERSWEKNVERYSSIYQSVLFD